MSAATFQQLITQVLVQDQPDLAITLSPLYQDLEKALQEARPGRKSQEEVSFRFERLRLGAGIVLMQLLTDLGGDEDSTQVQNLLQDALNATSIEEIDQIVQKQAHLFEDLYTDLYVNAEAEVVLSLFESALNAATQDELDDVLQGTLELAQDLELNLEDAPEDPDA